MEIADAGGGVDETVAPAVQAGNVTMITHWREGSADPRQRKLPAMGMAAKHQVPFLVADQFFRIRIMGQDHGGNGGISPLERFCGIALPGPEIAQADQLKPIRFYFDYHAFIVQHSDAGGLQHLRHILPVGIPAMARPPSAIMVADAGISGGGGGKKLECFGITGEIFIGSGNEIAGEENQIRLLGEAQLQTLHYEIQADHRRRMEIGEMQDAEARHLSVEEKVVTQN